MFPENMIRAMISQYLTVLAPPKNSSNEYDVYKYEISHIFLSNPNILGIVSYAAIFGAILASMKENGQPLLKIIKVLNDSLMILTGIIIKFTPIGVLFLALHQLLQIDKLQTWQDPAESLAL